MEATDFNSKSGKESQTLNPPATLRGQLAAEARLLEALSDLFSRAEQFSTLVESQSSGSLKGEYSNSDNKRTWKPYCSPFLGGTVFPETEEKKK